MDSADLEKVVREVKRRRQELSMEITNTIKVGDKVTFEGRHRKIVIGTVLKRKVTKLIVRDDTTQSQWNVTASLCKIIKPVK